MQITEFSTFNLQYPGFLDEQFKCSQFEWSQISEQQKKNFLSKRRNSHVKEGVNVTIGNPVFYFFLYLTGVHFRGKLQHGGDVIQQKINCWPIRNREIGGVLLSDVLYSNYHLAGTEENKRLTLQEKIKFSGYPTKKVKTKWLTSIGWVRLPTR